MKNFSCSGKKGDLIMLLYIIKAMGGGNLYLTKINGKAFEGFEEPLEKIIESCGKLISSQEYINSFEPKKDQSIDINLDSYRKNNLLHRRTLLEVMCNAYEISFPKEVKPWLNVPKDNRFESKIVIHRRSAHPVVGEQRVNRIFDWETLINNFGIENCIFVSRIETEWKEFGFSNIEFYSPKDNYEHACIIKGAKYFVGNQSFPSALADAVGSHRIFELSEGHHDRNHFAINYANNVWYYANPWDSTIKKFRYLKNFDKSKSYLDLKTGNEFIGRLEENKINWMRIFIRECIFFIKLKKLLIKRRIKLLLGYYN